MASKPAMLPTLLLSLLASHHLLVACAQSSSPANISTPSSPPCPSPSGFANSIIRAPLPGSPTLQIDPSFLSQHILFFYQEQNTALSQAAVASFCLDQCIAYRPAAAAAASVDPTATRPGPCRSFTVDMGKPYPPDPNDTAPRWYCEAFDAYLAPDLSDYVPVDAPGSYMYSLGVNRGCGGVRAY